MKTKKVILLTFTFSLFLLGEALSQAGPGYKEKGIISYFTENFENRRTASDEVFDNNKLVGSHRKIPFNSLVKVTNLANGKFVIIRVNDRGPYAYGRIMDISKAAAKKIDLISTGTAKAEIEVLNSDLTSATKTTAIPEKTFTATSESEYLGGYTYSQWGTMKKPQGAGIQIGSYGTLDRVKKVIKEVGEEGLKEKIFVQVAEIKKKDQSTSKVYKIIVGELTEQEDLERLKNQVYLITGYRGFIQSHLK